MAMLNITIVVKSFLLLLLVAHPGSATHEADEQLSVSGRTLLRARNPFESNKGASMDDNSRTLASASSGTTAFWGETIYYQAEDARTSDRVMITSFHNGYEGSGYGDYKGFGSFLEWDIEAPVIGRYEISTRYASSNSRPLELLIDGKPSGSFVIQGTSSWRRWYTETMSLSLEPGTHTLKLLASASTGPNVDWVSVKSPVAKAPVDDTPDSVAVFYQPEDAASNQVDIVNNNLDYQGDNGYADFLGQGAYLLWGINLQVEGEYEVTVRYSAKNSRSAFLYVDDQMVDKFEFKGTGSWHTWQEETKILYNLSVGMHSLMLRADQSSGPNIDWLSLRPLSTVNSPTNNFSTFEPTKAPTKTSSPTRTPTTVSPTKRPTQAPITPGPTLNPMDVVYYQPEDAKMNDVAVKTNQQGYDDNNGFADYRGKGAYLLWAVSAPISANYEITIRYAAKSARPAFLLMDGSKVDEFDFGATDSWRSWATETKILYLEQGRHSIMVLAAISTGPNLDWMSLRPLEPSTTPMPVVTSSPSKAPTTSSPTQIPDTSNPTRSPTTSSPTQTPATPYPTPNPTPNPTRSPTKPPTPSPTRAPVATTPSPIAPQPTGVVGLPPSDFPSVAVLTSREYLSKGKFVSSPSGDYKVGLTNGGNLVLQDKNSNTIWQSATTDGNRLYMQSDGNLILRTSAGKSTWKSRTYNNAGARFVLDDGGQISVVKGTDTVVWLDGVPRGVYNGPSSQNLQYPLRGIFYYPWYPETWTIGGQLAHYEPSIGYYSSSDPAVVDSHLDSFNYAHVDVAIASWWGPETNLDRARLLKRMDRTIETKSNVKWTVYYEDEMKYDPSVAQIRADLAYLKKWFAWHPTWAHVDGKPVIFIWNESDCEVVKRWMEAANGEWYVITKLFGDFDECPVQPSHWHQYGVGKGNLQYDDVSFTIAPGFWKANEAEPRFPRLSESVFCNNVKLMVDSGEPWQLIVSFNEAGEGTMIESSPSWASDTKYGFYLDCLHKYH